ncbi:MAG: NAD(P)/FAD-dependent oxidoreductase, partial [Chloroflexota bacterium]|nr:NAD(P)/FAD-dependent oxidoreductase [Chloroflexota bacterium]
AIKLPSGLMLPKAGVFAHAQAEVVADNIAADIGGKPAERRFGGDGSCFIETGYGKGAYGSGNFYAEPMPAVKLHGPGRRWHWGRMLFEWNWLRRWF